MLKVSKSSENVFMRSSKYPLLRYAQASYRSLSGHFTRVMQTQGSSMFIVLYENKIVNTFFKVSIHDQFHTEF